MLKIGSVLGLALLLLSSCSSLTIRKAKAAPIDPGATIGIICEDRDLFSLYLTASFIDAKFKVKVVSFEELFPKSLLLDLGKEKYSVIESIVENLNAGGQVKGNEEAMSRLLALNDLKDKRIRIQDYVDLVDTYAVKSGIRYLLYVKTYGRHSVSARLVDLRTREVTFTYYLSGDQASFNEAIKIPLSDTNRILLKAPVIPSHLEEADKLYIRLSEFLVSQMK